MYVRSIAGVVNNCVFILVISSSASAALIDRGGGLIYDDVLDITWLQDANYSATQFANSGGLEGDVDGLMPWNEASSWAANLTYYDPIRDITYDDWRLPVVSPVNGVAFDMVSTTDGSTDQGWAETTTDGTDGGWRDASNTPVSEMGHMYYVNLENIGECESFPPCVQPPIWGLNNTGPFINLQATEYWTDTETFVPVVGSNLTGVFWFYGGDQVFLPDLFEFRAWAVRDGDVGLIPIPPAFWLFGSGLIGLFGLAGRKKT